MKILFAFIVYFTVLSVPFQAASISNLNVRMPDTCTDTEEDTFDATYITISDSTMGRSYSTNISDTITITLELHGVTRADYTIEPTQPCEDEPLFRADYGHRDNPRKTIEVPVLPWERLLFSPVPFSVPYGQATGIRNIARVDGISTFYLVVFISGVLFVLGYLARYSKRKKGFPPDVVMTPDRLVEPGSVIISIKYLTPLGKEYLEYAPFRDLAIYAEGYPDNPYTYIVSAALADKLYLACKFDRAEKIYNKLSEADGEFREHALFHKGLCQFERDDFCAGINSMMSYLFEYPEGKFAGMAEYLARRERALQNLEDEYICPNCGHIILLPDVFCPHCHKKLETRTSTCKICGKKFDREANLCSECTLKDLARQPTPDISRFLPFWRNDPETERTLNYHWGDVYSTISEWEVSLMREKLEENGIPTVVWSNRATVFSLTVGGLSPVIRIAVPVEKVGTARGILISRDVSGEKKFPDIEPDDLKSVFTNTSIHDLEAYIGEYPERTCCYTLRTVLADKYFFLYKLEAALNIYIDLSTISCQYREYSLFQRGVCLFSMNNLYGGINVFESYLSEYPDGIFTEYVQHSLPEERARLSLKEISACSHCGSQCLSRDITCPNCGGDFDVEPVICKQCKKSFDIESDTCPDCTLLELSARPVPGIEAHVPSWRKESELENNPVLTGSSLEELKTIIEKYPAHPLTPLARIYLADRYLSKQILDTDYADYTD